MYSARWLFISFLLLFIYNGYGQPIRVDYNIDVTIKETHLPVKGFEEITLYNYTGRSTDTIFFHLYPEAFHYPGSEYYRQKTAQLHPLSFLKDRPEIGLKKEDRGWMLMTVYKDGKLLKDHVYRNMHDIHFVLLPEKWQDGDSLLLNVDFEFYLPAESSRLLRTENELYLTQWYPKVAMFDEEGWHPMPYLQHGEYFAPFGDYTVRFAIPENFEITATGVPTITTHELFTVQYEAENVIDFAAATGRDFAKTDTIFLLDDKEVRITILYKNKAWQQLLKTTIEALNFYSYRIGPYPYPSMSVVEYPIEECSGMEYPMLTVIGNCHSLSYTKRILVHEVGHNWFQAVLATNERKYPWLDEGLNSYIENKFYDGMDISCPSCLYRTQISEGSIPVFNEPENWSMMEYYFLSYIWPPMALELLEYQIGEEAVLNGIRQYYIQHKFTHPEPEDFFSAMEKSTGYNLYWFRNMLFAFKRGDLKIVRQKDNRVKLVNKTKLAFPSYILNDSDSPIYLSPWKGERIEKVNTEDFHIGQIKLLPDVNPANNYSNYSWFPKFSFAGRSKYSGSAVLNYYPYVGYNSLDGLQLGFYINNKKSGRQFLTYSLLPAVGLKTGELIGMGSIIHRGYPNRLVSDYSIGAGVKSYHYLDDHSYVRTYIDFELYNQSRLSYGAKRSISIKWQPNYIYRDNNEADYLIHKIEMSYERSGVFHPINVTGRAYFGNDLARVSGIISKDWALIGRQVLGLRLFGGIMFNEDLNEAYDGRIYVNGRPGFYTRQRDFTFENIVLDRSGDTWWGQQVYRRDVGLRTLAVLPAADEWAAGASLEYMPFRWLQIYTDGGWIEYNVFDVDGNRKSKNEFYWTSGLSFVFARDILEINFPLVESTNITDQYDLYDMQYLERVNFMLNLNGILNFNGS